MADKRIVTSLLEASRTFSVTIPEAGVKVKLDFLPLISNKKIADTGVLAFNRTTALPILGSSRTAVVALYPAVSLG